MRGVDRLFAAAFLRRAAFLWVGVRLLFAVLVALNVDQLGPPSPVLSFRGALLVILLVAILGLLEARRRNEHVFLANLGVPQLVVAALSAVPALAGELLVASFAGR